ncbi:MAG TPA: ATP-binding protein [Actinomycetota bacterium]|nr:ATP-binding protein [Actinomycetota bacterium]
MSGRAVRARSAAEPSLEACRRLALQLGLDVVGVAVEGEPRRITWWARPGGPPLPPRLEDVLAGRAPGWIVLPLPGAVAFALPGPDAEPSTAPAFRQAAPQLLGAPAGEGTAPTQPTAPRGGEGAAEPLRRAVAAVRGALGGAGGTEVLLEQVRLALGAERLIHVQATEVGIEVLAAPPGQGWRPLPRELRSELAGLPPGAPVEEGAARQLGVALGAGGAVRAAVAAGADGPELLLASWHGAPSVEGPAMAQLATLVGVARVAKELRDRAVRARLDVERTRWAFEIHDGVTQAVTSAVLELHRLSERIEADPEGAARTVAEVEHAVRLALSELRSILFELSSEPSAGDADRFTATLRSIVERWKLSPRLRIDGDLAALPRPVVDAALAVLREGLSNAAKHASSRDVDVAIAVEDGALSVEIRDRGPGPARDVALDGPRFGVQLMRRTVEEAGGTLELESSPGAGTRVVARLPVRERGEQP